MSKVIRNAFIKQVCLELRYLEVNSYDTEKSTYYNYSNKGDDTPNLAIRGDFSPLCTKR
jgi:hypothetical protein